MCLCLSFSSRATDVDGILDPRPAVRRRARIQVRTAGGLHNSPPRGSAAQMELRSLLSLTCIACLPSLLPQSTPALNSHKGLRYWEREGWPPWGQTSRKSRSMWWAQKFLQQGTERGDRGPRCIGTKQFWWRFIPLLPAHLRLCLLGHVSLQLSATCRELQGRDLLSSFCLPRRGSFSLSVCLYLRSAFAAFARVFLQSRQLQIQEEGRSGSSTGSAEGRMDSNIQKKTRNKRHSNSYSFAKTLSVHFYAFFSTFLQNENKKVDFTVKCKK